MWRNNMISFTFLVQAKPGSPRALNVCVRLSSRDNTVIEYIVRSRLYLQCCMYCQVRDRIVASPSLSTRGS